MKDHQQALRFLITAILFFIFVINATADDSTLSNVFKTSQPDSMLYEKPTTPSLSDIFFRIASVTVLILLIIAGGYWVMKRYGSSTVFPGRGMIRVIARHHIGPKQSLLLIGVEGRKLLIGTTEHNINLLADLGSIPETENQIPPEAPAGGFTGILQNLMKPKT